MGIERQPDMVIDGLGIACLSNNRIGDPSSRSYKVESADHVGQGSEKRRSVTSRASIVGAVHGRQ